MAANQAIHAKRAEPEASQEGNHSMMLAHAAIEQGSRELLNRLNAQFERLSCRARISIDDARLFLMNSEEPRWRA